MKYFIVLMMLISFASCSKIPSGDIFKEPKPEVDKTIPKKEIWSNSGDLNGTYDEVWYATIESIKWMKWKTFLTDKKSGSIVLKEAYVYKKDGNLKRIYHWPPKDQILNSDMREYIKTISNIKDSAILDNTGFTHENMRITLKKSEDNKVRIALEYSVFPYLKSMILGDQIESNYYIESLILEKTKENLR